MKTMSRLKFILLLLALVMLPVFTLPAVAAEAPEFYDFETIPLEDALADFMDDHKLTEKNFAMGWYDIESGDSYYFNGDSWFVAASMYKLPLAMACYDRIAEGTLDPTDYYSGWQLGVALKHAIVFSNNEAAAAMRHAISYDQMTYRDAISAYSGLDPETFPYGFYGENRISPEFMINTLKTLWDRSADFEQLIADLKVASPGVCFDGDEGRQYEMGHKYGSFEGATNDCAIVWAPRPYLLAAFSQDASFSEKMLRELYSFFEDYATYLHAQDAAAEAAAAEAAALEAQRIADAEAAAQLARSQAAAEAARLAEEAAAAASAAEAAARAAQLAAAKLRMTVVLGIAAAACLAAGLRLLKKNRTAAVCLLAAAAVAAGIACARLLPARETPAAEPPASTKESALIPAATASPVSPPAAAETPTPTPVPTPPYEPQSWTVSFAGDCTIGTLHEWRGSTLPSNMLTVVGEDYAYPFSNVKDLLASDDFTMVNLEGTFTVSNNPVDKKYRFSAPPAYARVLTEGSVEAVSLANNHSVDYGAAGTADTKAALEAEDILWEDSTTPIITELQGDMTLGVIPFNVVETRIESGSVDSYMALFTPLYDACRDAGCDIVIAFVHWGWEYRYQPEQWMKTFAHHLAELGCDMVIGSHAHVLQPSEEYNGVPIYYSLGNFCYGGNSDPGDKDAVLLRQEIVSEAPGEYRLGTRELIPCRVCTADDGKNDFCPTPYAETDDGYRRVLEKLKVDAAVAP